MRSDNDRNSGSINVNFSKLVAFQGESITGLLILTPKVLLIQYFRIQNPILLFQKVIIIGIKLKI